MATLELKGFSLCTNTAISEPGESVLKLEGGGGDTQGLHTSSNLHLVFFRSTYLMDLRNYILLRSFCCLQHGGKIICCPF